jgi:hypothetical protein
MEPWGKISRSQRPALGLIPSQVNPVLNYSKLILILSTVVCSDVSNGLFLNWISQMCEAIVRHYWTQLAVWSMMRDSRSCLQYICSCQLQVPWGIITGFSPAFFVRQKMRIISLFVSFFVSSVLIDINVQIPSSFNSIYLSLFSFVFFPSVRLFFIFIEIQSSSR